MTRSSLPPCARAELKRAYNLLENPGLAARISNVIGIPIEWAIDRLPRKATKFVNALAKRALEKALDLAIISMRSWPHTTSATRMHKWIAAGTGGLGGFFGLPGLAVELPVSTGIMLRSIAAIAKAEGADIDDVQTKLECIQVFALGGHTKRDNAAESGYFAIRLQLARSLSKASQKIAAMSASKKGAVRLANLPLIGRFAARVASRFQGSVLQKAAGQAVPGLGAGAGAIINVLFIDHFQQMAQGHFIVLRLERTYGADRVRTEYETLHSKRAKAT